MEAETCDNGWVSKLSVKYCANGHKKTPENVDRRNRCKTCQHEQQKIWRDRNKDKKNKYSNDYYHNNKERVTLVIEKSRYKRQYGISIDKYQEMSVKQDHKCAICGNVESNNKKLSLDHCHATGKIRSLLCQKCNRGLGLFNDNVTLLQAASEYLKGHHDEL